MPVLCPKCTQPLPPEDINVAKDVAFCRTCNEAFSLSNAVGDTLTTARYPQPANTQAVLKQDEKHIALMLPPGGFRGTGCFFAFFSGFWNLVTWGVFAGFVAAAFQPNSQFTPWMLLFFIPHMTIGAVTAVLALYHIFGDLAIAMDKNGVIMQRKLLGYTWIRKMPFEALSDVRLQHSHSVNKRPVYGVGLIFEGTQQPNSAGSPISSISSIKKARPMVFGTGLSEEEKRWLVGEFNAFFKQHRGKL